MGPIAQPVELRTFNPPLTKTVRRWLTDDEVGKVRERVAAGEDARAIADELGVSGSLVYMLCTGTMRPNAPGPITRRSRDRRAAAEVRFWEQVAKGDPDACWLWTGKRGRQGYGRLNFAGKTIAAHRFSLTLKLGRAMGGKEVTRHKCDNPPCVNPDHLEPGTPADNVRDTVTRGRLRVKPRSTLDVDRVSTIRRRRAAGETTTALGAEFGLSSSMISRICLGKAWKHVKADARPANDTAPSHLAAVAS